MASTFRVVFTAHLSPNQVASLVSQIASHGSAVVHERGVTVRVPREPHRSYLRGNLTTWDMHGFLRWEEEPESV